MLDKLYYIFHSSVKSGFAHAERASFLLSTSTTVYTGALCFIFMILIKMVPSNSLFACGVFVVFGIANGLLTSRYFVGTGRYRRIIEKYGSPRALSKRTRFFYRLISIGLFFIGSFIAFTVSGIMLSKYLNPW